MYCCQVDEPGFISQPHHIPGYGGHIPTYNQRCGASIGKLSRNIIEDPCVSQSPEPILQPPGVCCVEDSCCRNPVGCSDIGCCDPVYCPPQRQVLKKRKPPCEELPCDPCKLMQECGSLGCPDRGSCCTGCDVDDCCPPKNRNTGLRPNPRYYSCGPEACQSYPGSCDPRAHHLNRGPYACPCKPEPDCQIYRCCEPMMSSYTGHIPGFTFHSMGRTTGKASWGTKQYMNKCFYFNTFTKP